jgi:hypothetical protein
MSFDINFEQIAPLYGDPFGQVIKRTNRHRISPSSAYDSTCRPSRSEGGHLCRLDRDGMLIPTRAHFAEGTLPASRMQRSARAQPPPARRSDQVGR